MSALDLVPITEATHVVTNGVWPATTPGSRVHVPAGVSTTISDFTTFEWLRIDGEVILTDGADILCDLIVTGMGGRIEAGTSIVPLSGASIAFRADTDMDPVADPELVGRGLINMGSTKIHGVAKDSWVFVATQPVAGDTVVHVQSSVGWQVGDRIVVAGTNRDGWNPSNTIWTPNEDEVRSIVSITGNAITIDAPLVYDHTGPRANHMTIVGNLTRSVSIRSTDGSVWHRRGHTMTMGGIFDVRNVEFRDLGRTNKELASFDAEDILGQPVTVSRKARYPIHAHHCDMTVLDCAVDGSPGWCITHHDGHAIINDNVVHAFQGAGIVAEAGSETGGWRRNAAIGGRGLTSGDPKNAHDTSTFDLGMSGDGFWFQGRNVHATGNVAASCNTGFVYFHRGLVDGDRAMLDAPASDMDFPEALHFDLAVKPTRFPIRHFADNEAFACRGGMQVVKGSPNQNHDVHTHLLGFKAWNVIEGADFTYTSHYTVGGFDLTSKNPAPWGSRAINLSQNVTDFTIVDLVADGFRDGVKALKALTAGFNATNGFGFLIVNPTLTGMTQNDYVNIDPSEILTSVPGGALSATLDPLTFTGAGLTIAGTKTDSLGVSAIPAGTDNYDLDIWDMIRWLETVGYYDEGGTNVFPFRFPFSDRGNGVVQVDTIWVPIDATANLGHPIYANVQFMGTKPSGGCDCDALEAQIAQLIIERDTALANELALSAQVTQLTTDLAAKDAQIVGLQSDVVSRDVQIANLILALTDIRNIANAVIQ